MHSDHLRDELKLLALDFGLRRIGVAVGQSVTASASPAGVIDNSNGNVDFAALDELVRQWRPGLLVVGMPIRQDGKPATLRAPIASFVSHLSRYALPVAVVDEAGTSRAAETQLRSLRAAGRQRRVKKQDVDQGAAVLIAERYLAGDARAS